jgi:hypothetical protein
LTAAGLSGRRPASRVLCSITATRVIQFPKGRALDFAAVTDHSEWLGESNICFFEGNVSCQSASDCGTGLTCDKPPGAAGGTCVPEGYSSVLCTLARQSLDRLESGPGSAAFIALVEQSEPKRFPYSLEGKAEGGTCTFQAKNVWQQIIAAAEQNYDRTAACKFTSFIGYEYTSMPVMNQCIQSSRPCFADADCGEKDQCAQRGQCSQPYGKTCYVQNGTTSGCDSGGICVAWTRVATTCTATSSSATPTSRPCRSPTSTCRPAVAPARTARSTPAPRPTR